MAVLMHLDREGIDRSIAEVHRVLRQEGRFVLSIPSARGDITNDERDGKGRLITALAPDEWIAACEICGFRKLEAWSGPDGLGRPDVRWSSFQFVRNGSS